jgi:uncharacterized protein (DUF302 family)
MKNPGENENDSVSTQMKNTRSQVTETFQKLSSSLKQAGQKVTTAFSGMKNKVSSKK